MSKANVGISSTTWGKRLQIDLYVLNRPVYFKSCILCHTLWLMKRISVEIEYFTYITCKTSRTIFYGYFIRWFSYELLGNIHFPHSFGGNTALTIIMILFSKSVLSFFTSFYHILSNLLFWAEKREIEREHFPANSSLFICFLVCQKIMKRWFRGV